MSVKKKRISAAIVMVIMIVVAILVGSYRSLRDYSETVFSAYDYAKTNVHNQELYNQLANDYNNTLNRFPANILNQIAGVDKAPKFENKAAH